MILPPGRARLATKPSSTGSLTCANTIGMVRVACRSCRHAGCRHQNDVRLQAHQFRCVARSRRGRRRPIAISTRRLRPSLQPEFVQLFRNALTAA